MFRQTRVLAIAFFLVIMIAIAPRARGARPSDGSRAKHQRVPAVSQPVTIKSKSDCGECAESTTKASKTRRGVRGQTAMTSGCHPKGFLDPSVAPQLNAALRDLKRKGIKPRITSAWRSSQSQAQMHRCSLSRRCKRASGLYGALPAGQSAHEAGFAVDIAGVAGRTRRGRHLTPAGREIVKTMTQHGFSWRYGLADPVHFEASPQRHGYRTLQQAILRNQTRCQLQRTTRATLQSSRRSPQQTRPSPAVTRTVASDKSVRRNRS